MIVGGNDVARVKLKNKYDKDFYEGLSDGSVESARLVLERLYTIYQPDSVIDYGCGNGAWLSAAEGLGSAILKGYDGPWVDKEKLLSNNIDFTPVSLEENIPVEKKYDLCISVEVAEHLSPGRAAGFVRQLCSSSDVVLFGAATKGQGGTNHINEQWQSYWLEKFNEQNYQYYDIFRGALWNDERIEWWYRQNIFLYVNRDIDQTTLNTNQLQALQVPIIDLIHPEHFYKNITNPLIALKRYFQHKINSK